MVLSRKSDMEQPATAQTDLIVALDFPRSDQAFSLVEELSGLSLIYKIGFELFMHGGPDLIRELVHRKNRIFLDLKFHDIPNTVVRAACQAAALQVDMFTLHLAGGSSMVRAVRESLDEIPELRPKVLGVTVLTSFDDVRWAEVTRALTSHAVTAAESVDRLVRAASGWGLDGVVCSALELPLVREAAPGFYTVVPGIRPETHSPVSGDDQLRVMTPRQARLAGADAIVMGRPIVRAQDPRLTVQAVLEELNGT